MAHLSNTTTLEQFQASGRTITAFCTNFWVCSHDGQLRLELLALRLGWQFDFFAGRTYLASRLYCSVCGKYHPQFALGHASRPAGYAGTHGAGFPPVTLEEASARQLARQAGIAGEQPWVGLRKGGRKFGR